jgi:tripartite-type tricarboxylate transporter receptor subunit TctC
MRINPLVIGLCSLLAAATLPSVLHAQQYPTKPIRLIIGFGVGGATDVIARYYAQKLSEVLKTNVIVDNKPSAGQIIGIKTTLAAAPDGYTVFLGTGSAFSQGPGVRRDLPYDPLKDFTLISMISTAPGVMVISPSLPVRSVRDFIGYAKENPAKLNYGSSGHGAASHLQTEYFISLAGIRMTHIPYRSAADIMREIIAGAVHVGLAPVEGAMASIAGGRVRALAVTGSRRQKSLPEVPSMAEAGIKGLEGIDPYTYYGLAGPTGLPPAIVARLNQSIDAVSKLPDVATQLREKLYNEPAANSPGSFRKFVENDLAKWKELGKAVKLAE